MIIKTQDLVESVKKNRDMRHDILYVNSSQHRTIESEMGTPSLTQRSTDNVKLLGLDVIKVEELDVAILCKRGDILPLAKEWQN